MTDTNAQVPRAIAVPAAPLEEPRAFVLHGDTIQDPYMWLEDLASPAAQHTLLTERAYARAVLDALPSRPGFKARLESLKIDQRVLDAPLRAGPWLFYRRQDPRYPRPVLEARVGEAGTPFLVFDPAAREDWRIDYWRPSPQGRHVAVACSLAGNEQSVIFVVETETGRQLAEAIPGCDYGGVVWVDEEHFYHLRTPGPGQFCQANQGLRLHEVGTPWQAEPVLYESALGAEACNTIAGSPDGRFVAISGGPSGFATHLHLIDRRKGPLPVLIAGGQGDATYYIDAFDGTTAYVVTTEDAPLGKIMRIDLERPGREHWQDWLPEGEDVVLNLVLTRGGPVIETLTQGASRLRLHDLDGRVRGEVPLPGIGSVGIFSRVANNSRLLAGNAEDTRMYLRYSSFTTPHTVYGVDVTTLTSTAFEAPAIVTDPEAYEARSVEVVSRDGTRVPMTVVHRKGLAFDGSTPTLLCGYGGWGLAWTPEWRPRYMAWLAQGGVLASANVRGGNEFGASWHAAGRALEKQNTFDDFIACAEWLIMQRVTSARHLGIEGHSTGGLLAAAVLVQRPELFAAAVPMAMTYDMLRYHLDPRAARTADENGTAEDEASYRVLAGYSPYHRVRPGTRYPATLLYAAADDQRAPAFHTLKMGAAMRKAQAELEQPGVVLAYVAEHGGHVLGGLEFDADVLAFVWEHTT